jgi:PRTRC genetic system protein E
MFQQLSQMLRPGDTLALTIAREGDTQLRVNVMPKLFTTDGEQGADRKALNHPVSIVGTVEELDSPAFVDQLTQFATSVTATRNTLEEAIATHKAAADAKKKTPARVPEKTGSKTAARIAAKTAKVEPKEAAAKESETAPAPPPAPEPGPLGF